MENRPLRLDREARSIEHALRKAYLGSSFELEYGWDVTLTDLQDLLLRHRPHILHLSAHGTSGGRLVLAQDTSSRNLVVSDGEYSEEIPTEAVALGSLFAAAKGQLRCVILNTCHSEAQAQVIAGHVDCAIGMAGNISDAAAIRFSEAFYGALGYGQSLKVAYDLGCAQLGVCHPGEELFPRLFALRCDPAKLVLTQKEHSP